MRSEVKGPLWALGLSILIGAFPLILAYIAYGIARLNSCELNEADTHPCIIFGADRGDALYDLAMMGWLALLSIPVGAVGAVISLIWLAKASASSNAKGGSEEA